MFELHLYNQTSINYSCFLAKKPALALKKVQQDLKQQGFSLKVFDGYRPLPVQKQMWEILPDSRYVSNPETETFVILLTNRVHVPDGNVIALRSKVANIVAGSIVEP